jgi:hypothetical protein
MFNIEKIVIMSRESKFHIWIASMTEEIEILKKNPILKTERLPQKADTLS